MNEFEDYCDENYEDNVYIYSRQSENSDLLLKNLYDDGKFFFKTYLTWYPIGLAKIQNLLSYKKTHKNHNIDHYIVIADEFRNNSKNYTHISNNLTLIERDLDTRKANIYGLKNLPSLIANIILDFLKYNKYEVNFDYSGELSQNLEGDKNILTSDTGLTNPKVFFSYSWDNEKHKLWVLKLASALIRKGIIVLIDEWDLKDYYNDLNYFMESGIRESDYVILICTSKYVNKANKRKGGVGVENSIITGEYYDENKKMKYIPLVREYKHSIRDALPTYIKTKLAIDFSKDVEYEEKVEELLRILLNIPKYQRPKLGNIPSLETKKL